MVTSLPTFIFPLYIFYEDENKIHLQKTEA